MFSAGGEWRLEMREMFSAEESENAKAESGTRQLLQAHCVLALRPELSHTPTCGLPKRILGLFPCY